MTLGPRHRLHLIRCDGRDLLVMTGDTQDLMLGWLPAPHDPAGRG
jgi:flagellar protein FliO/FliZ